LRGEGEVGLRRSHRKYLVLIGHHLTYPLLRNGSPPLPPLRGGEDPEHERRGLETRVYLFFFPSFGFRVSTASGYAVVDLIRSMEKREVTFLSGMVSISFL
jgi:hypothetical protein